MTNPHALYGILPPHLLAHAAGEQYSPLIPGSPKLEACAEASLAGATLLAPPGTIERRYTLALALRALEPGATITALAPKDKGGSRIAAELRRFGCDVAETSRNHFRICTAARPAELQGIAEALAEGSVQQHPSHGLYTQPGVFSWDRIDAGSKLLLAHLPHFSGHGADLGCGLGVLSAAILASAAVQSLTLLDIDRRAVEAAQRNITDPRAAFVWADIRRERTQVPLDFVVMNPPFHDSGIEDKALGQQFIERAASWLKPGGQCWLTANRHLPYEALLASRFSQVRLVAEENGFKIYAAEK